MYDSQISYAKHRNISQARVSKLVRDGKIPKNCLKIVSGRQMIIRDRADEALDRNLSPSHINRRPKTKTKTKSTVKESTDADLDLDTDVDLDLEEDLDVNTFNDDEVLTILNECYLQAILAIGNNRLMITLYYLSLVYSVRPELIIRDKNNVIEYPEVSTIDDDAYHFAKLKVVFV